MPYLTKQSIDPTASIVVPHPKLEPYAESFHRLGHIANLAWKLDVGAECNSALLIADFLEREFKKNPQINNYQKHIAGLRSLVARVAEFEQLETE
ncbi:MAG: hypothetical protein KGL39_36915 [Patescibacteria group bacterium]|nr:hypothetical protein [Patescibacteria group bacterium]